MSKYGLIELLEPLLCLFLTPFIKIKDVNVIGLMYLGVFSKKNKIII